MTTAEYFSQLDALEQEEKKIQRKRNKLFKTFKNELPFKKGDFFTYKGYYKGKIKSIVVEDRSVMIQYIANQYDNSLCSTNWLIVLNADDIKVIEEPAHVVRFKKPGSVLSI